MVFKKYLIINIFSIAIFSILPGHNPSFESKDISLKGKSKGGGVEVGGRRKGEEEEGLHLYYE